MTPLVLEKPPEPVEKPPPPAPHVTEPLGDSPEGERFPSEQALKLHLEPTADRDESDQPAEDPDSPLKIELEQASESGREGRLRSSFGALASVRLSHARADWLEAAAALKADALRLRNSHLGRHADVLLSIADALTFTDPEGSSLDEQSLLVLQQGLSLLGEPFVSESAEEQFLVDLLRAGWHLAPAVDPRALAAE